MPAIVIHGLDDARTALRAAREAGCAVTLVSAPGAGGYAGAAWFDQVVRQACAEIPNAKVEAVLDCGDGAGLVMAALRQGLKTVRFAGDAATAAKLAEIAAAQGATVITQDVPALDLRLTRDRLASCRVWLAHE